MWESEELGWVRDAGERIALAGRKGLDAGWWIEAELNETAAMADA